MPREWILERIAQVEEAPCYDDIVVQSYIEANLEKKEGANRKYFGVKVPNKVLRKEVKSGHDDLSERKS